MNKNDYLGLISFADSPHSVDSAVFCTRPGFEEPRCLWYFLMVVSSLPWSARRCSSLQPFLHTSPPWSHPAAPCSSPQTRSAICQSHRGSPPWRLPCSARESRSWRKERRDLSLAWLHPRYWNISGYYSFSDDYLEGGDGEVPLPIWVVNHWEVDGQEKAGYNLHGVGKWKKVSTL